MEKLIMLHKILTHKILALAVCLLVIGIGTGSVYARSHFHSHRSKPSAVPTNIVSPLVATPTPTPISDASSLLNGQWTYMPGMNKDGAAYDISPVQYAIVVQDAVHSTPNAPLNLAGTYLDKVTGDFAVTTTLKLNTSKTATIQLYGKTPIIADEFRVERESVQMVVQSGKLTVNLWTGKGQDPALTQTFQFTPADTINLTMTRSSSSLLFIVNNAQVGSVKESSIFKSGQVWFGFDSQGGTWLLSDLSTQKLNGGTFVVADGSAVQVTQNDPKGIQYLASQKRPGFVVGEAMALGPLTSDPQYANVAMDKNMFGSFTPENEMKMINLQPQKGIYTFQKADAMVHIAKQNSLSVHGHALVFGEANPPWFNALPVNSSADKTEIEKIMNEHITTVMKHFGNDVTSWDVIDEPLADYDNFDSNGNIFRDHKWYQAMGSDYIVKALTTAYAANPIATLFINEYGLEADGERWDSFVQMMQQLKIKLQAQNVPTDNIGVGFESHVYNAGDQIDPVVLKQHIEQLAKIGFKSEISEEDVYNDDGDAVQSQQYSAVFNACLSEQSCVAWRGWILSDRYDAFIDDNGSIAYGIDGLFSSDMNPRPGLTAIQSLLSK